MNLNNYEYAGGGYYREKGASKENPSKLLSGGELLKYTKDLQTVLAVYLARPSSDGKSIRQSLRAKLGSMISVVEV